MGFKKFLIHGLIAAVLSSAACLIYNSIYSKLLYVNFDSILNVQGITGACIFASLIMATAYFIGYKWKGEKTFGWLNLIFLMISLSSIIGVLGFQLPLDIESPEMFPGLAVPMHFFPTLSFLTLVPFFKYNKK